MIIRDGAFFVPLIALLTGLRREEAAGLTVDDVDREGDIHVFHVRENDMRGVKTLKSRRTVPIHRELIRLGLMKAVEDQRRKGSMFVFPELRSASSAAMGDAVYDTIVEAVGPITSGKEGTLIPRPIHGLRHWCNNAMKKEIVPSEVRDDILGKRGSKESEDRYAEIATLAMMSDGIHKAECLTAHIPSSGGR